MVRVLSRLGIVNQQAALQAQWTRIEDLVNEDLASALIADGDIELAEIKERRRNRRLQKIDERRQSNEKIIFMDQVEESQTNELYRSALERKMAL